REEPEQPSAKSLMRMQLALGIVGNVVLMWLPLGHEFLIPDEPLSPALIQVGHAAGWLALLLCAGTVFWYVKSAAPAGRVHVLGFAGICLVLLFACAVNSAALPWVGYHVLIAAGGGGRGRCTACCSWRVASSRRVYGWRVLTSPRLQFRRVRLRMKAPSPSKR